MVKHLRFRAQMPDGSPEWRVITLFLMDAPVSERRFGEVVLCDKCGRSTSAARPSCIYCGHAIASAPFAPEKPVLSRAENWENGFNVVVWPLASLNRDIERAAALLEANIEDLSAILKSEGPVPLFRASDAANAGSLVTELAALGFSCDIVADIELRLQRANARLRRLAVTDGDIRFEDFNTGEIAVFALSEVRLLVAGTVREARTETFQKRAMFGDAKASDESHISGDRAVLDIYCNSQETGFRITPAGFDFSCLGTEKELMARENWAKLIHMLSEKLPRLTKDLEYDRLSSNFEDAWPTAIKSETKGLVKAGFGKQAFGRTEWSSNAEQFLRYSRLRWHLYEK